MDNENLTIDEREAASILKLSVMTLKRARKSGDLEFFRVGRRILYSQEHLKNFLSRNEENVRKEVA